MLSADDLDDALQQQGSFHRGRHLALAWVAAHDDRLVVEDRGHLRITLRLIGYDPEDDQSIRDIKEQETVLVLERSRATTSPERARAYVEGWVMALQDLLDTPGLQADTLMPADLVRPEVLDLKTCHSAEDFRARLGVKSRLGRWKASAPAHP